MADLNRITLLGRIGAEPEIIEFESGAKLTKFSLAVNRYDKKEKKEVADWFDVQTFSKLGEYLKKGYKVCVDGSLVTNVWENKDGKKVKSYVIQASNVFNLTPKADKEPTQAEQVKEVFEGKEVEEIEIPF